MNTPAQIANQFLDNQQKIDKEELRSYVYDKLTRQLNWVTFWVHGTDNVDRWHSLSDYIASRDREKEYQVWNKGVEQIMSMPQTIRGWINDHVDSSERFEFSVASKAAEIESGDDVYDYYMALTIRHDQLLSCVEVLGEAVVKLGEIIKLKDNQDIIEGEAFGFFCEQDLEKIIYETAQGIREAREKKER